MIKWILSCVIICLAIFLVRQIFRKKLSPKLQYMLWGFVLIRLLIPFDIGHSRFSVANLFPAGSEEVAGYEELLGRENVEDTNLGNESFGNDGFEDVASEGVGPELNRTVSQMAEWEPDVLGTAGSEIVRSETVRRDQKSSVVVKAGMIFKFLAFTGTMIMGVLFLFSYLHLGRKLRHNKTLCTRDSDPLPVYLTNAVDTPCLFGLFSPAIYLPEEYSDIPDARTHAVMHEWVHFRHGDHIWAILRTLCLILHWYNPFVWLVAKCSVTDAELACDADTIRILGEESRKSYGNTLISLTDRGNPSLRFSVTAMSSTKKQLKERIQMIVKKPKKNRIITCVTLSFCLVVGGLTFLGAKKQTSGLKSDPFSAKDVYIYDNASDGSIDLYVNDFAKDVLANDQTHFPIEEVKPFTLILTDKSIRSYEDTHQTRYTMEEYWVNESELSVGRMIYPLYDPGKYNHCFDMDPELAKILGEPYYMFGAKGNVTCPERYLGDEEKKEKWFDQIEIDSYFTTFRKSENANIMRYNNRFTIDQSLRDDTDCDELEANGFFKSNLFMEFGKGLWMDEDVTREGTDTYITNIERMPILYNEAGDQFVVYQVKYFNYMKADKKMSASKSFYFLFHIEKVGYTNVAMYIQGVSDEYMKDFQELFSGNPDDEEYKSLLNTLTLDFESNRPDYTPVVDYCREKKIAIMHMYNIGNNCLECFGMTDDENNPYRLVPFQSEEGQWVPIEISISEKDIK